MKIWEYSNSTNTIWTNFDCGEVEAETYEEAKEKAIAEMKSALQDANNALKSVGLNISIDFDDIQVVESETPYEV